MKYVFDANIFIDLFRHYYPKPFSSLWKKYDLLISQKVIVSVREVYNEIKDHGDRLSDWVLKNKNIFLKATDEEAKFILKIFKIHHFQMMIRKKELLQGKPVADPFAIAKAKICDCCVVTKESYKDNSANIPNVCKHFNIDCTNLEGFMERENWNF